MPTESDGGAKALPAGDSLGQQMDSKMGLLDEADKADEAAADATTATIAQAIAQAPILPHGTRRSLKGGNPH
jgi:hypothetical protein